ncbi:MAG: hypothetical protein KGM98_13720, partial [Bacteroidota bacterium]|nr:hypothetical protein [Bacteroidota bacterium]
MHKKWTFLFSLLAFFQIAHCQDHLTYYRITSSHTSFPDTARSRGHLYDGVLYTTAEHYEDSNVLIVVPPGFHPSRKVGMIFWFHGWNNNIDTALVHYGIARQFAGMGLNMILVLAETARDAPDSYGGKLEQQGTFRGLVSDVLKELMARGVEGPHARVGQVILAGHSGGYRVIAGMLSRGGVEVSKVVLFDALYANRDEFFSWLTASRHHRFIDIYTDHGGTLEETHAFMKQVAAAGIP